MAADEDRSMIWGEEEEGHNEYMTLGPYPFSHQRDAAANKLCVAGGKGWHMHSSDVCRKTGGYFCIMARWVKDGEMA